MLLCASLLIALAACEVILRLREDWLIRRQLGRMGIGASHPAIDMATAHRWDQRGESLLHIRSQNKRLVYELRPNAEVFVERFNRTVRTNSHGFRDYEFTTAKQAGVFRIIAVGDSVTFGWQQEVGETYPKLLEEMLNREVGARHRFEVYNMGVGGYNSEQEAELVRAKGLQFNPDLILVGYVLNDSQIGADAGLWRHFTRSRLRTLDFLSLQWLRLRERLRGKGLTTRSFELLARVSGQEQIPVVIVIFPSLLEPLDRLGAFAAQRERVAKAARDNGMQVIDLYDAYREVGMQNLMLDAYHPNAKGHRIAASTIFQALAEMAAWE